MTRKISHEGARQALHFDAQYSECVLLRDGTAVVLRLVRPSDKELLRRGLERLSRRSRYQRFFTSKPRLSEGELDYLTRTDSEDHLAIGAAVRNAQGQEEGLGIARFVRSVAEPDHAEAAVAVVDDWQNKGLGTILLLRLIAAARERGIAYFTAQVLATNHAMRSLLEALPRELIQPTGRETLQVRIQLPEIEPDSLVLPDESGLSRIFRLTGKNQLVVEPPDLRAR
jgi:GNAT superfamily N-acetyltransferase